MRFSNYLAEKFYDTFKIDGQLYDVFVNPSAKEIRELSVNAVYGTNTGYRYLIDFKHKKFYAVSLDTFHAHIMDNVTELPSYTDFLGKGGVGREWVYTGNIEFGKHVSDYLVMVSRDKQNAHKLLELLDQDWSWVSKYVDVGQIKKLTKRSYDIATK